MKGFQIIPVDSNINFIGFRFIALAMSVAIIIGSFVLAGTKGLNFGIDFRQLFHRAISHILELILLVELWLR